MPDLIAQGPATEYRWRRELPEPASGQEIQIGRSDADWNVPWDAMISAVHARLTPMADDRLKIECLASARNAIFFQGQPESEFTVVPGEHFVIGQTTFTLAKRPGTSKPPDGGEVTEHAYDHAVLRRRHFRDAAARIEMLSRLPDLITSSGSDEELLVRVTGVLLQATPSASAVAIVTIDHSPPATDTDETSVRVLHYDSRDLMEAAPPVSERLIRGALARRESVLHLRSAAGHNAALTAAEAVDWAFCVPLRSEACPGWALYVTGPLVTKSGFDLDETLRAAPDDLQDDVKFAELVGTTIANLRQGSRLQRRQAAMRHFFAPVVLQALAERNTDEVLEPRVAELSVMFCDLRGFSRRSERDAEHLLELLAHVSDALGVMTRHILDTGGVIGDFHGDAAMGFWGWPLEQSDSARRAVTAALRIRAANQADAAENAFRYGVGIATGQAVAGRIGTTDQVKVTAFGPVVNLASRLEGITKAFGAPVIIDQATAEALPDPYQSDHPRLRRLARVRPAGLESSVDILEVLAPAGEGQRALTDQQITDYEKSLDALIDGDWDEAYERLHALPAWDRPKDALLSTILRHNRVPPDNWDGVLDLPKM